MIEVYTQISCDGCGEPVVDETPNNTPSQFRRQIKSQYGWRSRGKLDYCSRCVADGKFKLRTSMYGDDATTPSANLAP